MALKKLHDPENGQMRIAGLISGSGSNLMRIIERGKEIDLVRGRPLYEVAVIFSDNSQSKAKKIGETYGIPTIIHDLKNFCRERGFSEGDLEARKQYDLMTAETLKHFDVGIAAYAGYMRIATAPLINSFLGINVHPADLSIMENGKRKYTGAHAVRDAIEAGEKQLFSTTHIVRSKVDYGEILMISPPCNVDSRLTPEQNQEGLKKAGDWIVFPKTLELIADGKFSLDESGNVYFNGAHIPYGLRMK